MSVLLSMSAFSIKAIGTQFSSTDIRSREIFARAVASRWSRCRATLSRGQGLGKGSGVRHICPCHLLMLVPAQPSSLILAMSWCTQFYPCSAGDLRVLEGSGALMGVEYLMWKFAIRVVTCTSQAWDVSGLHETAMGSDTRTEDSFWVSSHPQILNVGLIYSIAGKPSFILPIAKVCESAAFANSQISEMPKFSHLPCSSIHIMLFSAWDAKILIHATCCTSSQWSKKASPCWLVPCWHPISAN